MDTNHPGEVTDAAIIDKDIADHLVKDDRASIHKRVPEGVGHGVSPELRPCREF
ncbi:hypothetical protein ARZXY2_4913 (plasmid) [Arthrobacter sp. ZXY-2]|nr:hypothetical protein ARZXY2_4913 [Arthrobacter sp. ZXY-2]